jgi:signal transduction histidine kinase
MNDDRKTDPHELAPIEGESTADLAKNAELARMIQEIHETVGQAFVPLRTDIETLSGDVRDLTQALRHHTNNELRIMARLDRIEHHLSLPPLPEKADD